jgi:hypothetical protein
MDTSHLDALTGRLIRERARLAEATTDHEREFRRRQVRYAEQEIASERVFLGLPPEAPLPEMTDDELMRELS